MGLNYRTLFFIAVVATVGTAWADFDGPAPIAWRWADRIEQRPAGSPIVDGDYVYAAVGSRMYCLERESGNLAWRYPSGVPLEANFTTGAVLAGDLLIAATDDKAVYAINKNTGEMVWQYFANSGVFSQPIVAGNVVVLPLASNQLIAISLDSGQEVWDGPLSSQAGIYSAFASWHNYIFFLTSDGMLNSLDVTTKRSGWNRSRRFGSVSPLAGMAVFGDVLYITSGSYVTAVQAASGRKRWEAIVPGLLRYSPAVSSRTVVCVTDDGRMHAFNINGKRIFRSGIDLNSMAVASPSFSGSVVAIPTSNGALNLVDPLSGQIVWNFTVPPMIKRTKLPDRGTQNNPGGPGQGVGNTSQPEEIEVKYVVAAGPTSTEGDTLLMLAQDGSILAFDKNLGVDLTPPEAVMAWPNAGDQVSGRPPMEMVFRVTDAGSGVNFDKLEISINGQNYIYEIDREGLVRLRIYQRGNNKPLDNGRASVIVASSDWMGNESTTIFTLTIDNTLPALGSPGKVETGDNLAGGGNADRGGRGGGRGGG